MAMAEQRTFVVCWLVMVCVEWCAVLDGNGCEEMDDGIPCCGCLLEVVMSTSEGVDGSLF